MTRRDKTRRNRTQEAQSVKKVKRTKSSRYLHTRIQVPRVVSTCHPGTDFYAFVNGNWHKQTDIPPYLSTIGASEEIEEEIRRHIWSAISHPSTPLEKSLHKLATAGESISIEEIQYTLFPFLQRIAMICTSEDAAEVLGLFSRLKIASLLPWTVEVKSGGQPHIASHKRLTIGVGVLGLPEVDYYKEHGILTRYTDMIDKTAKELSISSPMHIAVPLEAKLSILRHAAIQQIERELPEAYTSQSLQRKYQTIPWDAYWKGVGIKPTHLELDSSRWIAAVESCFHHWTLLEWKAILTLHLLLWILPHLSEPFHTYFYEGYEFPLTGQRVPAPRSFVLYETFRTLASRHLGQLFVDRYKRELERLRPAATTFIQTLLVAAKRHVLDLEWMSPKYKALAGKRLDEMTVSCLVSQGGLSHSETTMSEQEPFLGTLLQFVHEDSKKELGRLKTNDPIDYWSELPYTVNAYYYHSTNQIIVPAANFFWPFFDRPERVGWNYGGLGSIVAHEITHSFDDTGRENWMAKNTREVTRRSKALIRLFNREKVFGRRVHGKLTISETMADLAGLKVALDACKQAIRHLPFETQQKHLRDFFISYAVSWRTKEHPSKQLQRLLIDLHAPPRLRVNLIVNHFQDWYDLFDVKPGDALYLPPSKRIHIL